MEKAVVTYPEKRKRTYIPGSKGMNKQYRATRIAATENQGIEAVRVKRIDKNVSVGQAVDERGVPSFAYKIPNGKMYKTAPRADKIPRGGSVPRVVVELGEQYQDVVGYQYGGNTVIPKYSDDGQPVTGGAAAVAQRSTGTPTFLSGTSSAKGLERIDDEFQNPASEAVYDAHKYLGKSNLRQTSTSIVEPKESSFAKVAGLVKYLPQIATTAAALGGIGYAYYQGGLPEVIRSTYSSIAGSNIYAKLKKRDQEKFRYFAEKMHSKAIKNGPHMDVDNPFHVSDKTSDDINYPNADLTEQTRGDAGVSKISSGLRKNYYNQQYITSAGPPLATHLFQEIRGKRHFDDVSMPLAPLAGVKRGPEHLDDDVSMLLAPQQHKKIRKK
jgi:hypothetical protein